MLAVLFDVDDTLYDQIQPFRRAFDTLFAREASIPVEALFASSRRHSDEVFELSQRGEITKEEMYIYRIQRAFADFQIAISDETALEFQHIYSDNQKKIEVSPRIRKLLEDCSRQVPTGIITNGPSSHQWGKIETLGLLSWIPRNHIFVSEDVGIAKPDVRIFREAAGSLQLNPEETYYVGDSYENDVTGARRAGWHSIWFNRRHHVLTEDMPAPDRMVTTEEELDQKIRSLLYR